MKVMYLTWGETLRSSGVYGTQVLNQVSEINKALSKRNDGSEINFISGMPLLNSGFFRERKNYYKQIEKARLILNPIDVDIIWILSPQTLLLRGSSFFSSFHLLSSIRLISKIKNFLPDVVHCRSYHACYAAIKAREATGFNFKIIFDARGLWPEQCLLTGKITIESYNSLKKIETKLLNDSDAIVSVSDPMSQHYLLINELYSKKSFTIYPSCPLPLRLAELPTSTNKSVIENKKIVFAYMGALNEDSWHKPSELNRLFVHIKTLLPSAHLKIVTKDSPSKLLGFFSNDLRPAVSFASFSNHDQMHIIMKEVDIAIMSYFIPTTKQELDFAKTVMAVKVAEYLSLGLPVLVNRVCGGASAYIQENKIGISYSPDTYEEITMQALDGLLSLRSNERIYQCCEKDFTYLSAADKYLSIYNKVTTPTNL